MKIIFDNQIFTLQSYGGISRYFVRLMQWLMALGHQVDVISPIHINRYLKDLPPEMSHGYEFGRSPLKSRRLMMLVNHQLSKLKLRSMDVELIHETYYSANPLCPTAKGRVITIYDMIHERFPNEFSVSDTTAKHKLSAVSRADHIICISHSTKNDLCDIYDIPEDKVSVVHLGFEKFVSPQIDYISLPKIDNNRQFLLYVGSRGGYKNFSRMLKAVAARPSLKAYDVVAFGGGPFIAAELELINALGFAPHAVRQVGGGDDVLGNLYGEAAAFVYPSAYEGFGLPPLEAMAHNCPVVTSNNSSMPEVVGSAGEYFDPLDIESQSQAICNVVFDLQRRNQLIELGRQRLTMFSWARCALETQEVYQQVIKKKGFH